MPTPPSDTISDSAAASTVPSVTLDAIPDCIGMLVWRCGVPAKDGRPGTSNAKGGHQWPR